MSRIDVVCPVFREEASIETFHSSLDEATRDLQARHRLRFIYVVDPAGDATEDILQRIAAKDDRVTLLVMSRRFGHQAALVAGLDESDGDAVIMLDSDMQHPPTLIPTFVEHWADGADIVQGVRKESQELSYAKRASSSAFYRVFGRVASFPIVPGAADYRLLSRRVADIFRVELRERNPFLRGLVSWVGFKTVYVPFEPAARFAGRSNYSVSRLINFALNGFCSFSKMPLRVCIGVGFALSVLSVAGGLLNVFYYFFINSGYQPGWASLFALLSFGTGINLFFLGVIGEYVSLIFDEVKARPRYIVNKRFSAEPSIARTARAMPSGALIETGKAT